MARFLEVGGARQMTAMGAERHAPERIMRRAFQRGQLPRYILSRQEVRPDAVRPAGRDRLPQGGDHPGGITGALRMIGRERVQV